MIHDSPWSDAAGATLLVVARFRVAPGRRVEFLASADQALEALAAQEGCRRAGIGQATDDADLIVLSSEWTGVGDYRRALSAFDVKARAVPLLSEAVDEPTAYELVREWTPEGTTTRSSGLAADAGSVGLGGAAAPRVAPIAT